MSQKDALLEIHKLSHFVNYSPKQVLETYEELKRFLAVHIDHLTDLEYFNLVELNFYLTLMIGKLGEAKISIDRILDKFGDSDSERIAVLKATFLQVSKGNNEEALNYLKSRPANELLTLKKRISITKANKDYPKYISSLNAYLQICPTDTETWAEVAETYFKIGHYDKAIFAYEETLMIHPFNYIVHARIGELYHLLYLQNEETGSKDRKTTNLENLINSFKFFSRSVELVSNYIRGWSGLLLISSKLQKQKSVSPEKIEYKQIKELAKTKLNEVISKEQASYEDIESAKKIISLTE